MKKFNGMLKGFVTIALVMTTSLSAFTGCSCQRQNRENTSTTATNDPGVEIITTVAETVSAYEVANGLVSKANVAGAYDEAILGLVQKNYNEVESIKSVVLDKDVNGKLTIVANVKDENNQTKEVTLEYEGDTRSVYAKETNENILAQILAKSEIDLDFEFEKNSQAYDEFESFVSAEISSKLLQTSALQNIVLTEKAEIDPPEIEYVSVQSIVDEIWGDVDTRADIQAVAKYLTETKYTARNFDKLFSVDLQDGRIKFYTNAINKTNESNHFISELSVDFNGDDQKAVYAYFQNKDKQINNILAENNLTINQTIIKNSNEQYNIIQKLQSEKDNYDLVKNSLYNETAQSITAQNAIIPNILSQSQMQELGISDMNEFAQALQTNTRGTGFDQVAGWTMDDVLETYISVPSGRSIDGYTSFRIWVLTESGITEFGIAVLMGDLTASYTKFLIDSADVIMARQTPLVEHSNEVIVFGAEEGKIDSNTQLRNTNSAQANVNSVGTVAKTNERIFQH